MISSITRNKKKTQLDLTIYGLNGIVVMFFKKRKRKENHILNKHFSV